MTRLLERMPECEKTRAAALVPLQVRKKELVLPFAIVTKRCNRDIWGQVVVVAVDCKPKWLTKHVGSLAASRKVPVIMVRDGKGGGSLALGGLLKLKTALAIGVKVPYLPT